MTVELMALTLAALLQTVQYGVYAVAANLQVGPKYAMGPRDEGRQVTGFAGRAQRTMNNTFEGLILFAIAAVVITISAQSTPVTQTCAWVFLGARVLFAPAYYLGLSPWRSVIWGVGFFATIAMLIAALVPPFS